jgi:hypothetical protein
MFLIAHWRFVPKAGCAPPALKSVQCRHSGNLHVPTYLGRQDRICNGDGVPERRYIEGWTSANDSVESRYHPASTCSLCAPPCVKLCTSRYSRMNAVAASDPEALSGTARPESYDSLNRLARPGEWRLLGKFLPCISSSNTLPDLYGQAEGRAEKVDEVIAKIPLVDDGENIFQGAITMQERLWLLTRWLSERNRLQEVGTECAWR